MSKERNADIRDWMAAKGFYVLCVGPEDSPDYLIISTDKPENFTTEKNEEGCVKITNSLQPGQDLFVLRTTQAHQTEERTLKLN